MHDYGLGEITHVSVEEFQYTQSDILQQGFVSHVPDHKLDLEIRNSVVCSCRFVEEDRPLEAAFSRARSFSQKLKRKGKFVPRGMIASEYEAGMLLGKGDDLDGASASNSAEGPAITRT